MSSFRTEKIVLREEDGTFKDGIYIPGARTHFTILASGQPVLIGQDIDVVAEGRTMSDYRKFYSDTLLKYLDPICYSQPDIIVDNGYGYEIMSVEQNTSNVIPHVKYICSKIFKFTTVEDWINGNLPRNR